jgi:hypothetical protein
MPSNMAVDADVLSAGVRQPTVRRSLLRYIGGSSPRLRFSAASLPALLPSRALRRAGWRAERATLTPRTAVGSDRAGEQWHSRMLRPETQMFAAAVATAARLAQSEPLRVLPGSSFERRGEPQSVDAAPRGGQKAPYNRSIDTDAQRRPRAARAPVGRRSSLR